MRRARAYAGKTGQEFHFDPRHGKGSHGTVFLGDRMTTVKRGELGPGLLASMLRDLGIDRRDW